MTARTNVVFTLIQFCSEKTENVLTMQFNTATPDNVSIDDRFDDEQAIPSQSLEITTAL